MRSSATTSTAGATIAGSGAARPIRPGERGSAPAVRDAVGTALTAKQREVVEAHFFDGLSQGEIARRLGVAQQVVQKRLFAGRRRAAGWSAARCSGCGRPSSGEIREALLLFADQDYDPAARLRGRSLRPSPPGGACRLLLHTNLLVTLLRQDSCLPEPTSIGGGEKALLFMQIAVG